MIQSEKAVTDSLQLAEATTKSLTYSKVLEVACDYGFYGCVNEAEMWFYRYKADKKFSTIKPYVHSNLHRHAFPDKTNAFFRLNPNYLKLFLCTKMRRATKDDWNFVYESFAESTLPDVRKMLLGVLGCTRQRWILESYMLQTLDKSTIITPDEIYYVFESIAKNPMGHTLLLPFVDKHYKQLNDT